MTKSLTSIFAPGASRSSSTGLSSFRMFSNEPFVSNEPSEYISPENLPNVFRLTGFAYATNAKGGYRCSANVFSESMSLRVVWDVRQPDIRFKHGVLVSIRWTGRPVCAAGEIHIARLVLAEIPVPSFDLMRTIPREWVRDRTLVARAAALLDKLTPPMRHLFNAVFWEGGRLHRFLTGPSSVSGHHSDRNGNFRHTVEVGERCLVMAECEQRVATDVLILAAFLHDSGKADEYRFDRRRNVFEMSDRGALVGHRHTVLEWIAAALATQRIVLPEIRRLGLLHCLTAAPSGDFLGIRAPVTIEAMILSAADRLSGKSDLFLRNARADCGFGRYHKHLRGRPFLMEVAGDGR